MEEKLNQPHAREHPDQEEEKLMAGSSAPSRDEAPAKAAHGKAAGAGGEGSETSSSGEKTQPILEEEVKALREEVERLRAELAELRDKYLRTLAERENLVKRHGRELVRSQQRGTAMVLEDLLPVADALRHALAVLHEDADLAKITQGMEQVLGQFRRLLSRHGARFIEESGVPYDPRLHQAVDRSESEEVAEPTVGEVYQVGFEVGGQVLRPATVQVLVPPEGKKEEKASREEGEESKQEESGEENGGG